MVHGVDQIWLTIFFTKNILEGKKINVFGHGKMWRDFTYIDDIVNAIEKIVKVNDNKMFKKGYLFKNI